MEQQEDDRRSFLLLWRENIMEEEREEVRLKFSLINIPPPSLCLDYPSYLQTDSREHQILNHYTSGEQTAGADNYHCNFFLFIYFFKYA